MFAYYILPFHKNYSDSSSCNTPASSRPPSRANSGDNVQFVTEEKEPSHKNLKEAVKKRDGVCLFCWDTLSLEGAHIIAQKNIPMAYDKSSLLQRAGLIQKHQVQNGLLLCNKCHDQFDKLKRYVDVVDDKLVIKVVNETNDESSDKHREWMRTIRDLRIARAGREEDWTEFDNRQAVDQNGESALCWEPLPSMVVRRNISEQFNIFFTYFLKYK
jgi:hypothetical protein